MSDEAKKVDDGGPAFPVYTQILGQTSLGLSKREWFAGMALQGIISGCYAGNNAGFTPEGNVVAAFEYADLMIERRKW